MGRLSYAQYEEDCTSDVRKALAMPSDRAELQPCPDFTLSVVAIKWVNSRRVLTEAVRVGGDSRHVQNEYSFICFEQKSAI